MTHNFQGDIGRCTQCGELRAGLNRDPLTGRLPPCPDTPANLLSVKRLIEEGDVCLPDMITIGHTPTKFESNHRPIIINGQLDFELCLLPTLDPISTSGLLADCHVNDKPVPFECTNEASIDLKVVQLLNDILKGIKLYDSYTVQSQVTLTVSNRGDVFVLSVFGVAVLFIENKRERDPRKVYYDEIHLRCLGQAYDYLQDCRLTLSIGYSFALWSCFKEFQIICPDDDLHRALAQATEVPEEGFPRPSAYDWDSRAVLASPVYRKANNVPKILACLIWKLHHSYRMGYCALTRPVTGVEVPKLRAIVSQGYFFTQDHAAVAKATFRTPASNSKTFYLLQQKVGGDGTSWIALNTVGKLAVVKFSHARKVKTQYSLVPSKHAEEEDVLEGVEEQMEGLAIGDPESQELMAWKRAYTAVGARPFIVQLAHRPAMVLPFAFCYNRDGSLSSALSQHLPCEDSFGAEWVEWKALQAQLVLYQQKPREVVLFTALKRLASVGIVHLDIKWCHLALLPFDNGGQVTLEPILVDLARVAYDDPNPLKTMADMVVSECKLTVSEKKAFQNLVLNDDSK